MDNVCRKALRQIQDHIMQIRDFMKDSHKASGSEVDMLNTALKYLVIADVINFILVVELSMLFLNLILNLL